MTATWLRVRRSLRRRWLGVATVAVAVGVVVAVVLTLAGGARRTASAPDRYTASVGGDVDAEVEHETGPPRTAEVAALPSVEAVDGVTFVFGELVGADGQPLSDALVFAGTREHTSQLRTGRWPAATTEFVVDDSFPDRYGARVGDRFTFQSLSPEQFASNQAFGAERDGPTFTATLVGVVKSSERLNDTSSIVIFPLSLLDLKPATVATVMTVRLVPAADLPTLRKELDTLPDGASFRARATQLVGPEPRRAVDAEAKGLWILAVVAAVASALALGQLLLRHARLPEVEQQALSAIGATRADIAKETVLRAAVPAAVGVTVGMGLAVLVSGIFPRGFTRGMEPDPGMRVDAPVLLVGGAVLLGALLGMVAVAARRHRARRPSMAMESVARRVPGPAATGVRFALTTSSRASASVRSTVAMLALVVAGLVAATAFAASLERLVTDKYRFGQAYTMSLGDGLELTPDELRSALEGNPDVAGLTIGLGGRVRSGDRTVELAGLQQVRGDVMPRVLEGRLARAPDEVALGRVEAHTLGVGVGDDVTFTGSEGDQTYRVVGLAVVPSIGGSDGVGDGAVMTADGLLRVEPEPDAVNAAVEVRDGVPRETAVEIAKSIGAYAGDGGDVVGESLPSSIINLDRIVGVPVVLAGVFALLAVVTLLHGLVVSFNARRKDLAVLRALGADGSWVSRSVHWQASILAAVPFVLGVPFGLALGAALFRAVIDRVGAVPDPSLPFLVLLMAGVALVLLANVVALVPAVRARQIRAVDHLRPE